MLRNGHPEIPVLTNSFDLNSFLAMIRRAIEAFCRRCDGLSPAVEQEPTDVAASLTCAICGDSMRPPIVVARPAASRRR